MMVTGDIKALNFYSYLQKFCDKLGHMSTYGREGGCVVHMSGLDLSDPKLQICKLQLWVLLKIFNIYVLAALTVCTPLWAHINSWGEVRIQRSL